MLSKTILKAAVWVEYENFDFFYFHLSFLSIFSSLIFILFYLNFFFEKIKHYSEMDEENEMWWRWILNYNTKFDAWRKMNLESSDFRNLGMKFESWNRLGFDTKRWDSDLPPPWVTHLLSYELLEKRLGRS